ncbi:hypothetical protein [Sphingobacterium chungjuense]|uniref:hypothetical protein n=1 Tax=Sphingobacterium chungjuense TaxID=2675553 RepID=UPI00140E3DF6|nr:hypothetical protein [Sphingobacterium chungjuense]
MKKLLFISLIAGLGFASCQKETVDESIDQTEESSEQTLILKGKEYKVSYVKKGMSKLFGIPVGDVVYDDIKKVFGHAGYAVEFNPADYIDNIEILTNEGYEF